MRPPLHPLHPTATKDIHVPPHPTHNRSFVKAELARKKQEYDASLKARISASVAGTNPADSVPALEGLPYVPYLDEKGMISDSGADAKVKASVYAVHDESGTVRYIGVSRSVAQSLRLHLARVPEQTYGFKVFHITKPSRVLLEITRDTWIEQLGYKPEVTRFGRGVVGVVWYGKEIGDSCISCT